MVDTIFIHYIVTALVVVATSVSVGISQGLVSSAACSAINMQPKAKDDITNTAILSTALIETASISGIFVAILLWFEPTKVVSDYVHFSQIGIALAMCLAGAAVGFFSALPAQQACFAIARQPFQAAWIFRFTLIALSIMQTPLIFAFIVSWLIKAQAWSAVTLADSLRLIGAGCAIGLGTIGPIWGMGLTTRATARGAGINRTASSSLMAFTFISQSIIETPIIFSLIISLLLLFYKQAALSLLGGIAMLAAGICIGIGTIMPGISAGRVARAAADRITIAPQLYNQILNVSIFAQGFIDTNAIYALVTAILIIFFV